MVSREVVAPQGSVSGEDVLHQLCASLQPLPSVLRYYDEFDDTIRAIRNPSIESVFELFCHGRSVKVDFGRRRRECALIFKHILMQMFKQDLSVRTVANYFSDFHHFTDDDVAALARTSPLDVGLLWAEWRARELSQSVYKLAKHMLQLLCIYRWNGWSQEYRTFLSTTLPLPAHDKYAAVRSGDAFLSADEEAAIVRHLDEAVIGIKQGEPMLLDAVADAGMLLCAYQFAMRPVQIGMLDTRHVRVWNDEVTEDPTVHLTFHMAKQRRNKQRIPLTRRVKREWTPIFTYLKAHLDAANLGGVPRFFQVESVQEVSIRISKLVRGLIGSEDIGTATDLRHTAAQRLVDAGASHEELAEFMGHAQTNTGLVYYATSASHAERVNRALGASEVYRRVAKIGHDRFISPDELSMLKEEQQIAAVPHGIPISGIGGCQSGQPHCPYSPVASCYGCRKFMPVADKALHGKVLSDMREIVLFFEQSSRGDVRSPTYLQLQRTIGEIQTVIAELEVPEHE
ncbi:phage integrase family protein [Collimonas sp. PA-H2]|uniref:tyrosine-type recombinase/integrase n=1 Tax=Collimonas sp. PA-H2 TaxID=1881062 RepID=UPI000BF46A96|nr:tyrosine-type recombinase/integrase [Collimonas sp. PA-H2]PFH12398.1 phage integrase family protein [Collimonas sp. PA-H2]